MTDENHSLVGYQSYAGFGVDVASQRADDLDKLSIAQVAANPGVAVLEVGCGAGGQSLRLAQAGAQVTALDQFNFSHHFTQLREQHHLTEAQLWFVQGDMQSWLATATAAVSVTVCQRTLHYVPALVAEQLLAHLYRLTTDALFVSVTGLESAVGLDYAGTKIALADRFFSLSPDQAARFSIYEPVCLYTKDEFVDLLERAGWHVERCWDSAFGNIKAVCRHH